MKIFRVVMVSAVFAVASYGLAANVVGVWNGKIQFDMAKIMKNAKPDQKQLIQKGLAGAKKVKIVLTLKADRSFITTVTGSMAGQNTSSEGKWMQSGKTVTLTTTKRAGKPVGKTQSQVLSVAPNGKMMFMPLPGGNGKIVFSR